MWLSISLLISTCDMKSRAALSEYPHGHSNMNGGLSLGIDVLLPAHDSEYAAATALKYMYIVGQILSYHHDRVWRYLLTYPAIKCLIHEMNSLNRLLERDRAD